MKLSLDFNASARMDDMVMDDMDMEGIDMVGMDIVGMEGMFIADLGIPAGWRVATWHPTAHTQQTHPTSLSHVNHDSVTLRRRGTVRECKVLEKVIHGGSCSSV